MKVLVIDDDPAMLTAMKRLLLRTKDVEIAGMLRNAADAIAYVEQYDVDLAFVDIKIAGDDGLTLARKLREMKAELDIVFVTSHKEYALDAFDAYPLDYIVKPVSGKRLEETLARASRGRAGKPESSRSNEANRIAVEGLGGLQVSSELGGAVKWMSRKSLELFAYLLLCRGQRAAKIRILEDVFPDRELKNSDLYLNTAAYQLRRALASHGMKDMLASDREQYQLLLGSARVDFIDFEQRLPEFHTLDESNAEAAIAVEQLYIGDLFEDKLYTWAMAPRERLSDRYEAFAKRLVQWLLDRGEMHQAVAIAKKLVQRNELHEEANMLLLQGFAATKDKSSLQFRYKRYAELLDHELALRPSAEMAELYRRLL